MKLKEAAALRIAEKLERRRESTVEGCMSALKRHVPPRWGECVFGIDVSTGEARYRLFGTAHNGWVFLSGCYSTV